MMAAIDNTRGGKRSLLYNGHNRKPGAAARDDTRRWRKIRRGVRRRLTFVMEGR